MEATLIGLGLGLSAGLSPGPLNALVIEATLARGLGAGIRTSLAPLLSDTPLVVASLLLLRQLPQSFLDGITLVGGIVILTMGVSSIRSAQTASLTVAADEQQRDLWRAAFVNLLNPNAWLFWFAVGGPILLEAWPRQPLDAIGFLVVFLTCLVGLKVLLACVLAKWRERLGLATYRRLLTAAACLLLGVGGVLIVNGLRAVFG